MMIRVRTTLRSRGSRALDTPVQDYRTCAQYDRRLSLSRRTYRHLRRLRRRRAEPTCDLGPRTQQRVIFRVVGAPDVGSVIAPVDQRRGHAPFADASARLPRSPVCPSSAVVRSLVAVQPVEVRRRPPVRRRVRGTNGSGSVQRHRATAGEGTSPGVSATERGIMRRRILIFGLPVLLTIPLSVRLT